MKIFTIVGARPQFVKAATVSRAVRLHHEEILVHTGQHYDDNMSAVFFEELGIPQPDCNLGVGSGPHGEQTAAMLVRLEKLLLERRPDWVLVYGDTNTTLAGALAAAKLRVRVAHVEAGLRSFNRAMPEELNRVVVDHASDLLCCPSRVAVDNLAREGIVRGVHLVGDVMADALAFAATKLAGRPSVLDRLGVAEGKYLVVTLHRAENADRSERLREVLEALHDVEETVVFPVHPRTRNAIASAGVRSRGRALSDLLGRVRVVDPLGHLDMVSLVRSARMVLTDSGGLQKEAYWLHTPCITLREETEWTETVATGWNTLTGADRSRIVEAIRSFSPPAEHPPLYGDAHAASRIVRMLETA